MIFMRNISKNFVFCAVICIFTIITLNNNQTPAVPQCPNKVNPKTDFPDDPVLEMPHRNYSNDYEIIQLEEDQPKDSVPTYRRKNQHVIKQGTFLTAYDSDDWHGVRSPFFFYAYSALYDNRKEFGKPRVVVVGIAEAYKISDIYCSLVSTTGRKAPWESMPFTFQGVTPDAILKGGGKDGSNIRVADFIFYCPMRWSQIPSQVRLAYRTKEGSKLIYTELSTVNVEKPEQPEVQEDLAICVAHLYKPSLSLIMGKKKPLLDNPYQVVEWVEMQKILGVSKISLYVQAVGSEVMKVLHHYSSEGIVDIHSFGLIGDKVFKYPRSTAISDCMHRYMHTHKMIHVIDVDEVLVPKEDITIMELLKRVADANNITVKGNHFQFANDNFYTDHPGVDNTKPFYSTFLRHRYNYGAEPFPGPMKSVQDPYSCKYTTNHQCFINLPGAHKVYVDPTIAVSQHYKDCETSRERLTDCKYRLGNSTLDNIMLRYESRLLPKVRQKLKFLHLL